MRVLPGIGDRGVDAALVVRTDFGDEAAWQGVAAELMQPWGEEWGYEAVVHLVDDPVWAGATPDEVQAAAEADDEISVVFLADSTTMREPHHALLAVRAVPGEQWDDEESEEWAALGLPFRTEPRAVHDVYANLSIANMDFEEFAEAAREDPEGVLRPL
jgi:hypothetical protein